MNLQNEISVHTSGSDDNTIHWWVDFFNITDKEELVVKRINKQLEKEGVKYALQKSLKNKIFYCLIYVLVLDHSKTSEKYYIYG